MSSRQHAAFCLFLVIAVALFRFFEQGESIADFSAHYWPNALVNLCIGVSAVCINGLCGAWLWRVQKREYDHQGGYDIFDDE